MKLNDKVYDILKWLALIALNAIGVLYKTLATIWGWPFGEEILTTCAALALFIGTLLGISTAEYNKSKNLG
nr:MAG TPA: holin [Caudoviricetes sp.]